MSTHERQNLYQIPKATYDKIVSQKEVPELSEFQGTFSLEEIAADQARLKKLKILMEQERSSYQQMQKEWAEVFEIIVCLQVELGDWLGGDAMTSFTSEYDDVIHGVDGVIELGGENVDGGNEAIRFGFDCTFSQRSLDEKISRICDHLNRGRLYDVKYFISPHSEKKRYLRDIPLVTIFTDKETVKELTQQWAADKKKLAESPFKFIVLEQILFQLLAMRAYLRAPHCLARGERKRVIQSKVDIAIESIADNVQQVLVASFDERAEKYVKDHPHIQLVQRSTEMIFNLRSTNHALPQGYTSALQWALDRNAPAIVKEDEKIPDIAVEPETRKDVSRDIHFVTLVHSIRDSFGQDISHARVMRVAQKEAKRSPEYAQAIYRKQIDPATVESSQRHWIEVNDVRLFISMPLAEVVYACFKKMHEIPDAPEGWRTNHQVYERLDSKDFPIKPETVKKLARILVEDTGDITLFQADNNRPYYFYSPGLITRIEEYCLHHKGKREKITIVPYESGWKSIREIAVRYKGEVSHATVRAIAYEHMDQMKIMLKAGEQPIPRCSPALEALIDQEIQKKKDIPVPGPEEMTRNQLVDFFGGNRKTVFRLLKHVSKEHPEWKVERRQKMSKPEFYYTREAREALAGEIRYIQSLSEPQTGEMTNQAAARYVTMWLRTQFAGRGIDIPPIADVTLKKVILRLLPDENERERLIHDRITADKNYYPHLSPPLIERLKQEFRAIYETPVPGPGEVLRNEMIRRIKIRFGVGKHSANNYIDHYLKGNEQYAVQRRRPEDSALIICYFEEKALKFLERTLKKGK